MYAGCDVAAEPQPAAAAHGPLTREQHALVELDAPDVPSRPTQADARSDELQRAAERAARRRVAAAADP